MNLPKALSFKEIKEILTDDDNTNIYNKTYDFLDCNLNRYMLTFNEKGYLVKGAFKPSSGSVQSAYGISAIYEDNYITIIENNRISVYYIRDGYVKIINDCVLVDNDYSVEQATKDLLNNFILFTEISERCDFPFKQVNVNNTMLAVM